MRLRSGPLETHPMLSDARVKLALIGNADGRENVWILPPTFRLSSPFRQCG